MFHQHSVFDWKQDIQPSAGSGKPNAFNPYTRTWPFGSPSLKLALQREFDWTSNSLWTGHSKKSIGRQVCIMPCKYLGIRLLDISVCVGWYRFIATPDCESIADNYSCGGWDVMMRYDAGRAGTRSIQSSLFVRAHSHRIQAAAKAKNFLWCLSFFLLIFSLSPPLSTGVDELLDVLALFTVY